MSLDRTSIHSPLGPLTLEAVDGRLTRVGFHAAGVAAPPVRGILAVAARQLADYFAGSRREFDLPLRRPEKATTFQHRVWDAMMRIPFGETRTYGELARELDTSPRAIGGACGRNELPIVIPCHRVVAAHGLGGYSGDWEQGMALDVKAVLLEHEARSRTSAG